MKSFLILFLFSLYSQTLSTESNKRDEKYQTWAQRRTLNQERLTINNTFTDRMTESLKDFYKEIEKTDFIRKALMYGSMNNNTRAVGQMYHVYMVRTVDHINRLHQEIINSKELFETDRLHFNQSIPKFDTNRYLRDIGRAFGTPDQRLIDMPILPSFNYIIKLVDNILKKGSVLEKATTLMAHLGIFIDVYRHLVNSREYRRNDLAVNTMCIGIGFEEACTELEYFLDYKGSQLFTKEQDKLIILYQKVFKGSWTLLNDLYKASQTILV